MEGHSPLKDPELLIRAQERIKVFKALTDVEAQLRTYEAWLKTQHPTETRARMRK